MERDGLLWVADLPLGAGANTLTLTMTDAVDTNTTNLTVIQSTVQLVLGDLTSVDLNQPRITVSGTINASDHKIWVNGVEVTNVSGWDWWVEGVPVNPGGTAVIHGYPDHGQWRAGTGGSGGSEATVQNPGNPTSPNAKTVEGAPDKQPEVVQVHYNKMRLDVLVIKSAILSRTITTQDRFWQRNQPGHDIYDYCEDGMGSQYTLWTVAEWGEWLGHQKWRHEPRCGRVRDEEFPRRSPVCSVSSLARGVLRCDGRSVRNLTEPTLVIVSGYARPSRATSCTPAAKER